MKQQVNNDLTNSSYSTQPPLPTIQFHIWMQNDAIAPANGSSLYVGDNHEDEE